MEFADVWVLCVPEVAVEVEVEAEVEV